MSFFMNLALGVSLMFSSFPLDRLSYMVTLGLNSESFLHR